MEPRPRPQPSVALCALPLGYGPAAKLLALAGRLRALGIRPVCIGSGIARELAARSGALHAVIDAAADSPAARAAVRAAAAVVSFMDPAYAALALEEGRPLHVVDSLFWMRDRIPPSFLQADRYWVQDFIGVRERLGEVTPRPTVVGPIVPPARRRRRRRPAGLVVNLGGYESPYAPAGRDSGYAGFVARGLLGSGLCAAFHGDVLLMAGGGCVARLQRGLRGRGIRLASLPHDEAADAMAGAAIVLTSPGLTATLECFQAGVPTFFLPPQNYSQWWILKKLRAAGLAPCAYHWEDSLAACRITERMPMAARVPLIREAIAGQVGRRAAAASFRRSLAAAMTWDRESLAAAQTKWFRGCGRNGTETIARHVARAAGAPSRSAAGPR